MIDLSKNQQDETGSAPLKIDDPERIYTIDCDIGFNLDTAFIARNSELYLCNHVVTVPILGIIETDFYSWDIDGNELHERLKTRLEEKITPIDIKENYLLGQFTFGNRCLWDLTTGKQLMISTDSSFLDDSFFTGIITRPAACSIPGGFAMIYTEHGRLGDGQHGIQLIQG